MLNRRLPGMVDAMVLSGCRINSSLTKMINYKLKAALPPSARKGTVKKDPKQTESLSEWMCT